MPASEGTFSESWYRIAPRRVVLRPQVRLTRQMFRGEKWHVLHDPFGNQYFRLRPAAYEFIARLSRDRTVDEVWKDCLRRFPDEAPGQQEVIRLLSQLFYANLIQSDEPADSAKLFERHRKKRQTETRSRLLNIMFARFHLLDPDRFLLRAMPWVRPFLSPLGLVLWVWVLLLGIKSVADHAPEFLEQTQGALAPGNLPLLYVALFLVKILHEFSHAFVCRRFGGEVHDMGIMLLIFTPLPYVNATAAWAFRERWKRVLVGLAGMMAEVFVASLAAWVWASVGPGPVRAVAYNMILVASVSTVLFNANPLLRYDGYYILSDLVETPNLHARAARLWRYGLEHRVFGVREEWTVEYPAATRNEAVGLGLFGALAAVYRVVVFGGILLVVGNRFLLIGVILAAACAVAWIIRPLMKLIRYLASAPCLSQVRPRAVAIVTGTLGVLFLLVGAVPFPATAIAPGMVRARDYSVVCAETAGALQDVIAPPGSWVEEGTPLVRLKAPELDLEIETAKAQQAEVEARWLDAMGSQPANLKPLQSAREVVRARCADLESRRDALVIRARHAGQWSAPGLESARGAWFGRGAALGSVVNPNEFFFDAILGQSDAVRLFGIRVRRAGVRLRGEAIRDLPVTRLDIVPGEQTQLPSPALGWTGGGEVPVDPQDNEGRRTVEPFFEVRATLPRDPGVALLHGRTGRIRLVFDPEPLARQWLRKFRQLVQQRYQL